jgi:hypothetical protein
MSMEQAPEPQPPARMSQGRLIVTIAAGIVLAVVVLALLPFLFLGGVAILGFGLHLLVELLPLAVVVGLVWVVLRLRRRR